MAYKNIQDQKNFTRKWYLKNKERLILKAKKLNRIYITRNKDYVNEIKLRLGCKDCVYNKSPYALDFDHLSDKVGNISRMLQQSISLKALDKEIAKCEVVCANCHRIRTQKRRMAQLADATTSKVV